VLVDWLCLWLARVMDECGAWTDCSAGADTDGGDYGNAAVTARVIRLLGAQRATSRPVVAVSNGWAAVSCPPPPGPPLP
jgi:adenosylcobinamide kinase/adenosylcobinamide-phosphate guanylyltransferase